LTSLTVSEARYRFDEAMLRCLKCSLSNRPSSELKARRARLEQSVPIDATFSALDLLMACYHRTEDGIGVYRPPPPNEDFVLAEGAEMWFGRIDPVLHPDAYIRGFWREINNHELAWRTGLSEHTVRRKLGAWHLKRL
jgi:hypothetical protein